MVNTIKYTIEMEMETELVADHDTARIAARTAKEGVDANLDHSTKLTSFKIVQCDIHSSVTFEDDLVQPDDIGLSNE